MLRPYPLALVNGAHIIQLPGGTTGTQDLAVEYSIAPSAGTVTLEVMAPGAGVWSPVSGLTSAPATAGRNAYHFGPVHQIRVTFSGLVGGAGATLWISEQAAEGFPPGAFTGTRALITQSYTEANSKNGLQFEAANYAAAIAAGANFDMLFVTGSKPVIIKTREISTDSPFITARVYSAPTITANGTASAISNLSTINPVVPSAAVYSSPTVSAVGTEIAAPTYLIGSTGNGQAVVGTFVNRGNERVLSPNTAYLLRVNNGDSSAHKIAVYWSWYEGAPDLPLPA